MQSAESEEVALSAEELRKMIMKVPRHRGVERSNRVSALVVMCLMLAVLLPIGQASAADMPLKPHAFYGTLLVVEGQDVQDAPVGVTVLAKVNGVEVSDKAFKTKSSGKYGSDEQGYFDAGIPMLIVQGDIENGATIEFYVEGVKADQTYAFESGEVTYLELTVAGPLPLPGDDEDDTSASGPAKISWPVVGGVSGGLVLMGVTGYCLFLRRRPAKT